MHSTMKALQSILIHASVHHSSLICKRDLLVSPSMTLYQLHHFITSVFEIDETEMDDHRFITDITKDNETIVSYDIVDHTLHIDGFLTLITPGLYIGRFLYMNTQRMIIICIQQNIHTHMNLFLPSPSTSISLTPIKMILCHSD